MPCSTACGPGRRTPRSRGTTSPTTHRTCWPCLGTWGSGRTTIRAWPPCSRRCSSTGTPMGASRPSAGGAGATRPCGAPCRVTPTRSQRRSPGSGTPTTCGCRAHSTASPGTSETRSRGARGGAGPIRRSRSAARGERPTCAHRSPSRRFARSRGCHPSADLRRSWQRAGCRFARGGSARARSRTCSATGGSSSA